MSLQERIQEAAEQDAVITGAKETVKQIEEVEEVVIATNTPRDIVERVQDAAADADVECTVCDADNQELGSYCMVPYTAGVVGIKSVE